MSTEDTTGDLQPLPSDERPTAAVPPGVHEDMLPVAEDLPMTRMRRGYDTEQVDALVEDVFDAVRSGGRAPVIAETRFRGTTGLRSGYEERAVDDYLDALAEAVGQQATPEPSAGAPRHPGAEQNPDDAGRLGRPETRGADPTGEPAGSPLDEVTYRADGGEPGDHPRP
ncbi:hypothetical protein ACQE98_07495 [Ornithinimicrobium sp. W1679]|uniref:hypothetical protein n=1 Tax=Ornithinimicrobium sp. W1679 TaxID=3418770 RepID=UPI003CF8F5BA